MNKPHVLQLVDSFEYVAGNCYQHQLLHAMRQVARVETCALSALHRALDHGPLPVVCCLKQRTLHRQIDNLAALLGSTPMVIYDQDPHHAYMDDSPYKGVYEQAAAKLNVKKFCVTSDAWARFIRSKGLPGEFVRMWMLPEYCDRGPAYDDRPIRAGFVGTVHPYRRRLFDSLSDAGHDVNVCAGNSLPYRDYLKALSNICTFVHSEDVPVQVEGKEFNLGAGPWIKDVEAAARGCFAVRNRSEGAETYLEGIKTVLLYDDLSEVPGLLDSIQRMPPEERQYLINESVGFIQRTNRWQETARTMTTFEPQEGIET